MAEAASAPSLLFRATSVARTRLHRPMHRIRLAVRYPGTLVLQRKHGRSIYKAVCRAVFAPRLRRLNAFARSLPAADVTVPARDGYLVVEPATGRRIFPSLDALVARCQRIVAERPYEAAFDKGKGQLHNLIDVRDLEKFPEFLDFALDPRVLAVVADYLGALPVLRMVELWRSVVVNRAPGNSQLYHNDHEDLRQMKVFVYVSDVDEASGPLTVVGAAESQEIRDRLGYVCKGKIPDARIRPLLRSDVERTLTGPRGTIAFVDTSQVLHFGSRVQSTPRYVVQIQYVSPTCFYVNPFDASALYPYRGVAHATAGAQTAVLRGIG
jgi:hypothetical protein